MVGNEESGPDSSVSFPYGWTAAPCIKDNGSLDSSVVNPHRHFVAFGTVILFTEPGPDLNLAHLNK